MSVQRFPCCTLCISPRVAPSSYNLPFSSACSSLAFSCSGWKRPSLSDTAQCLIIHPLKHLDGFSCIWSSLTNFLLYCKTQSWTQLSRALILCSDRALLQNKEHKSEKEKSFFYLIKSACICSRDGLYWFLPSIHRYATRWEIALTLLLKFPLS